MESTATKTIKIDGMTGDACVQKVTGALKGIDNVTTESVKVGTATIKANGAGCKSACAAIDKAGYKAQESGGAPTSKESRPDAHAKPAEQAKPAMAAKPTTQKH